VKYAYFDLYWLIFLIFEVVPILTFWDMKMRGLGAKSTKFVLSCWYFLLGNLSLVSRHWGEGFVRCEQGVCSGDGEQGSRGAWRGWVSREFFLWRGIVSQLRHR